MRHSLTNLDRLVRAYLIAPAAVVVGILIGPGAVASIVLYVIAAVMLGTAAAAFCPLYAMLDPKQHHLRLH